MTNKAYELAQRYNGLKEWAEGSNPEIDKMFADAGHAGNRDDVPWCAAFVGAMLRRAGMLSTGKLNARSYLDWGVPVERKDAQPGDIVIFKRGNSSWQGHVAFFVKDRGALIDVLGGNQADAVNVKGYQAKALLGIRRATNAKAGERLVAAAKEAKAMVEVPEAITKLGYKTVKDFQRAYGLEVDGIVGPKTRAAMQKVLAAPKPANSPAQRAKPGTPADTGKPANYALRLVLGLLALAGAYAATAWADFTAWVASIFN